MTNFNENPDILGTTVAIDASGAEGDLASSAASGNAPMNEAEAIASEQADHEAASDVSSVDASETSASGRKRSADVLFREQQRNQAAAERNRAARERANAAAQGAQAAAARTRKAEALADRAVQPPSSRSLEAEASAFSDFTSGFTGTSDQFEDAWEAHLYQAGVMTDREKLRYQQSQFRNSLPEAERASTGIDREARYSALEDWASGFQGGRNELESSRRAYLVDKGVATAGERERVLIDGVRAKLPEEEKHESLKDMFGGMDMAYAIGYGGAASLQGVANAWHPALAGEAYLPGQAIEQTGTSALPAIGAVVATGAALALTKNPAIALGAQFIGQGVGQGAQDSIDTYMEGHTFAQQRAGESLGYGRGGADAVNEFVDALKNAATPAAKELAETFTRLGQTGQVSPGAASQFGALQFAQGTAFEGNQNAVDSFFSSNPGLARMRVGYGTGPLSNISSSDYVGAAGVAALQGNYAEMHGLLANAESSVRNPQWDADKSLTDDYGGTKTWSAQMWRPDKVIKRAWGSTNAQLDEYGAASKRLETEPEYLSDPKALKSQEDAVNAWFVQHQTSTFNAQSAGLDLSATASDLQRSMIYGGGSGTIRAALPAIAATAQRQIDELQTDITNAQTGYAGTKSPDLRAVYHNIAATARAQIEDVRLREPTADAAAYSLSENEAAANYGLASARGSRNLTLGLLGGRSWANLGGAENEILNANSAEARRLRSEASSSQFLHPDEAAAYRTRAAGLDAENAQDRYTYRMAGYNQTLGHLDIGTSRAEFGVQQANLYGGPGALDKAYEGEADAFKAKIAELTKEIHSGNLTMDDSIAKTRELTQARSQEAAVASEQARAFYSATMAIQGAAVSGSRSDMSMDTLRGGSGGAIGDYKGVLKGIDAQIQTEKDRSTDPRLNAAERAQATANVKDLQLQHMQEEIAGTSYTATPGVQTDEIKLRGALGRAAYSYLEPGNIDQMRGKLFGVIGQEQRDYEKQIHDKYGDNVPDYLKPGIAQQEEHFKDERAQVGAELDRSYFDKLPALTIGGPSFEKRYLPTYSQAAAYTEKVAPTLAAHNFGFFKSGTYDQAAGEVGPLGTAGKSPVDLAPGNLSLQALAHVIETAIMNGMKNVTLNVNGSRAASPGMIQNNNARTRGLGAGIPGAGG